MPFRTSRRPSRARALLSPPPGTPRGAGPRARPPRAHGRLRCPCPAPSGERGETAGGVRRPARPSQEVAGAYPCPFPVSPRPVPDACGGRAALPASRPLPALLLVHPWGPPGSSYLLRAPSVALPAPRPVPTRACVVLRAAQAPVRVRGLSRRLDSGLSLPRPRRSRARPGDAALPPGRARALRHRCRPLLRLPTKHGRESRPNPGPERTVRGGGRSPPLLPPSWGLLSGGCLSRSWPPRGMALPGPRCGSDPRGSERPDPQPSGVHPGGGMGPRAPGARLRGLRLFRERKK